MKSLDSMLEMLHDSQWHSLVEIKKEISLNENTSNEVTRFLQKLEFIEKEKQMLRIKSKGLKFLELPL